MPRRITCQQVFEAAHLIVAKELGLTQDNVRAFLGSGSRAATQGPKSLEVNR